MPDALQPVAACADNDRRSLSADRAPVQAGQVIRHNLQRVQQIIEILDLTDRAEAAHGHADCLAQDGHFADAGVGHAQCAIFFLHSLKTLVHVAQVTDILAKSDHAWVTP